MGKKWKQKKAIYIQSKKGDLVKVEIRDESYRVVYRNKFNIRDRNAVYAHLQVLEQFSGFSIQQLIKEKIKTGEWW